MMAREAIKLCSITNCPQRAVTSESGSVGQWIVVIPYCAEHARELNEGAPLGAVGLDSSRLLIAASDEAIPEVGGQLPGID